jgi:hypothetical protein
MSKTVDEKLDDFLEIEGDISVAAKNIVPAVKGDLEFYDQELERNKDIEEDYEFQRTTLYGLVSQGQTALANLVSLAEQSQHPRAYEVAGQLMKTTGELAKDLIELQVTMNKVSNTKNGGGPQKVVNNNSVFVGDTNQLLEALKGKNRVINE